MEVIVFIIVGLIVLHLAGGARHHRQHYRQHGLHPHLMYTYGRGWWGSVNVDGFRVGHRLP